MWLLDSLYPSAHQYYVYSTGTDLKNRYFNTRKDAEVYMYNYCNKNGILLECTECDKHERKYSNHNGIRFYINRV
jgi:hypothetical protein